MKIKTIAFFTIFSLMAMATLHAQNVTITDDSTHNAHGSSMLDVYSISKGFLIPRLTTTQRTGIASPATGLIVFDTDSAISFFTTGVSG
jgi:hypothetical protein